MKKIAIFASGTGSNAKKIIEFLNGHNHIEVALIVSNRKNAYVLNIADQYNIPKLIIKKDEFYNSNLTLEKLKSHSIDFVILAGFLWLVPLDMIDYFNKRMFNIHPSLLPKFGGKGMYGMNVHQAVKEAGETQSGITIHFVNSEFDKGEIIFQATCAIEKDDSPATIAQKVLELEHKYYPKVIERTIMGTFDI